MSVFKKLAAGDHFVDSFEVNYSQSYSWISGSAGTNGQYSPTSSLSGSGFSINLSREPPSDYPGRNLEDVDDDSDVEASKGGITDGNFYSYPLYNTTKRYFYVAEDVGKDGSSWFRTRYNDLDLNADDGAGHYSFNTVGGNDVSAGTLTNAGLKGAASLLIHKTGVHANTDYSSRYEAVTVGDIVTYKISDRRWYKYKIISVDTSPTGMANRYRFGIELIDSDTSDGTGNLSYTAKAADARFTFTGPGGNIYDFYPSGSMFVWNIPSNEMGEGIKRDTFKIELDAHTLNVQDDGDGKLRLNGTGSAIGNIFYEQGIATVQQNMTASTHLISEDGISITGSAGVTSSFRSTVNIYEHRIGCKIKPSEFNTTFNPTTFHSASSGTGSYSDQMFSGSTLPYVTTVGLYNDVNELLAVAKLSHPIIRTKYTDQTFVIKFDE